MKIQFATKQMTSTRTGLFSLQSIRINELDPFFRGTPEACCGLWR